MATCRDRKFNNICHLENTNENVLTIKNSDTCANRTENHDIDDTPREEITEFLVKYRDRVYNIHNFLNNHPGGKNTLMRLKDQNLDKELAKNPHSKSAYYLLEEFAVQHQVRYNEYEKLINWDKPILWQVGFMGEQYWEWVNLPVNRPIRLFQSDILEKLSISPWYILPIIWLPIITYFFYMGCVSNVSTNIGNSYFTIKKILKIGVYILLVITAQNILPSLILGLFIWTILEFFFHRKIFHFRPPHNSKVLITLHFLMHGNHHKAPLDDRRQVFPPIFALFLAAIAWEIYKAIFPMAIVHFIAVGSTMGYLGYDLMHYYLHNGAPMAESYLYTMKRKHNYHHFVHHEQGFGITNGLWDRILNTDLTLKKLKEPLKW
ncbi:Fatty acid 2-hydroxylase [Trachymyrmex septentrionalis]|uniref:Fatty acid 2-hydroxylase n=1 Tax=Trachymyrmex septentrionalis TaxID=34720 RepID=A0A151JWE4_9HYME|nr:Fatty acid 2-hydroxylase [Trachymyrmex septentrionalis]